MVTWLARPADATLRVNMMGDMMLVRSMSVIENSMRCRAMSRDGEPGERVATKVRIPVTVVAYTRSRADTDRSCRSLPYSTRSCQATHAT